MDKSHFVQDDENVENLPEMLRICDAGGQKLINIDEMKGIIAHVL